MFGLAFATALFVGVPAAHVYLVVTQARAHNVAALVPLCAMLLVWLCVSVSVYPRFLAALLPCGLGAALPRFAALPREAGAAAAGGIPAYEQPDAARPGGVSRCAVCLGGVEKGEMVKRMPVCLHVFHRDCVDLWLMSGHSTCPVCRCDAFEMLRVEVV